jgi:pimeloyl-ACP methyl ester carboxylesterase
VPTTALNGLDLYYEQSGSGPRLLFLNGSGASIATTEPMITPFRARFEVLVHDQRGLGRTSVPDPPFTMAQYAADAAALLDHVGWATCRVVGISFGGMVAQELAVTWPERIERLALVCTSPGGVAPSYPLHELATLPAEERAAMQLRILDTRFTPEWFETHPSDRLLLQAMVQRALVDKTEAQLRGEAEQLQARRRHDVVDRLGNIRCPTLVASGRFDGIAPADNGRLIAERIAGAELRPYDGGHAFWLQDRQALPDVIEFLGR